MEMAIAMLISGIICGSVTMTIFQVFDSSSRTSNHMTAVRQVQSAGYWVSRDAQMVQQAPVIVNGGGGELESITLDWTEWGGTVHVVTYELQGTDLVREENGQQDVVAQFIDPDPAKTSCVYTNGKLTFTVTVTVGAGSAAQIESRTYGVIPRPG